MECGVVFALQIPTKLSGAFLPSDEVVCNMHLSSFVYTLRVNSFLSCTSDPLETLPCKQYGIYVC